MLDGGSQGEPIGQQVETPSKLIKWILVVVLGGGAAGGKVLFDHSLSDRVSAVEAKLDLILGSLRLAASKKDKDNGK